MMNKKLARILTLKFRSYCQHLTLHGVYYFHKKANVMVYVTWIIILVFCFSLCVFLGHMIWDKFITDPTVTVVEYTHYPISNIEFPAVVVCSSDVVYGPSTGNITHILQLRGYNTTSITDYYRSFTYMRQKEYAPPPHARRIHELLLDLGYTLHGLIQIFRKPCDTLILRCVWRSKIKNCSHMFREKYLLGKYCCHFDTTYFRLNAPPDTNFVAGIQKTEGLEIVVDGQNRLEGDGVSDSYAQMYVFDEKNTLTVLDDAINLTPATQFEVNVDIWAIDSSNYVKALSLESRKCVLKTDTGVAADFYEGCVSALIIGKAVKYCRCIPFNLTARILQVPEYITCGWEHYNCIYQVINSFQGDIREVTSQYTCYQKCDYVQYATRVDFIHEQRINSNCSSVAIYFSDTTCMKYRREVLYTWDQMLANLGGIFGLCLGGSMISIIELLWFLVDLTYTWISGLVKLKVTPTKKEVSTGKPRREDNWGQYSQPASSGPVFVRHPYLN